MNWLRTHTRSIEVAIAAIITTILVQLHFAVLTHAGALWRDEISSLHLATLPSLASFWSSLVYDPFPAFYFFLLRIWSALGLAGTDFDLRALGLLTGLTLLAALWFTCWRINRSAPLWPLALFALNPVALQFGDSIRAYGVGLIWIVLSFVFIWQLTFREVRPRTILLASASAVLSVQTLFTNSLLLFALCVAGIAVCARRKSWRRVNSLLAVGTIAAASLSIYAPIFRRTHDWSALCVTPTSYREIFVNYSRALGEGSGAVAFFWVALMLGGFVAALSLQFRSKQPELSSDRNDQLLFGAIALAVATAAMTTFFRVVSWPTSLWYFLPLMALSAICLHAIHSTLLESMRARILGWVVVLCAAGMSILPAQRHSLIHLTNADLMAQAVASQAEKDDLVLVSPYFYAISFQRYYHGTAPWTAIPAIDDYSLHRWDLLKHAMEERDPIRETLVRVQTTLQSGHKIFLVGAFPYRGPDAPVPFAPAPQTPFGWELQSYLHNWAAQTSFLIYQHVEHSKLFLVSDPAPVSGMERLWVFEVSGWKRAAIARTK